MDSTIAKLQERLQQEQARARALAADPYADPADPADAYTYCERLAAAIAARGEPRTVESITICPRCQDAITDEQLECTWADLDDTALDDAIAELTSALTAASAERDQRRDRAIPRYSGLWHHNCTMYPRKRGPYHNDRDCEEFKSGGLYCHMARCDRPAERGLRCSLHQ